MNDSPGPTLTKVRTVLANRLMMQRRGNPAMGGPSTLDYRRADELIEDLTDNNLIVMDMS